MPATEFDPPRAGTWIALEGGGRAYAAPADAGTGPGLLVLDGTGAVDAGLQSWCDRFAGDGYAVLATAGTAPLEPALAALRARAAAGSGIGVVATGAAADAAIGLGASGAAAAVVVHGMTPTLPEALARCVCPCAVQLAAPDLAGGAALSAIRALVGTLPRLRLYEYPGCGARFFDRRDAAYEPHAAGLAHTRTLGTLRPAIGPHYDLARLLYEHLKYEFVAHDPDATMATMVEAPYVNHVPTMTGGVGHDMLKRFYKYHFIPNLPQKRHSTYLSETIGPDTVVLEFVTTFTHDVEIDYLLPGIAPTGKEVRIPTVLIAKFHGDKLYNEHIYWDQASVLTQLGLLDPKGLPVAGVAEARKMLDQSQPANELMEKWKNSAGKPI